MNYTLSTELLNFSVALVGITRSSEKKMSTLPSLLIVIRFQYGAFADERFYI
jgi:hypothetical protein